MTFGKQSRPSQDNCSHTQTISVSSSGVDRIVCEICGHVSVSFTTALTADIQRTQFARPADSAKRHAAPNDSYWQSQELALSATG